MKKITAALLLTLVFLVAASQAAFAAALAPAGHVEVYLSLLPEEPAPEPDRTKPIYNLFAKGHPIKANAEIQWLVRDFAEEHGYPEKVIIGMMIRESGFNPKAIGGKNESFGLSQIQPYWATAKTIPRLETTKGRDLLDPRHNILTLIELWNYARDKYNIDTTTDQGMKDLLYWHNTGKYIKNVKWRYSEQIFGFVAEMTDYIE